jgi:hypothetical protein
MIPPFGSLILKAGCAIILIIEKNITVSHITRTGLADARPRKQRYVGPVNVKKQTV